VHPDRNRDHSLLATEAFKKLSKAYEVLSNDSSKRTYDASSMFGWATSDTNFTDEDSTFHAASQSLFDELSGSLGSILTGLLSADSLNSILAQLLEADILDEPLQEDLLKLADLIREWKALRWEQVEPMLRVSSQIYSLVTSISSRLRTQPGQPNGDALDLDLD